MMAFRQSSGRSDGTLLTLRSSTPVKTATGHPTTSRLISFGKSSSRHFTKVPSTRFFAAHLARPSRPQGTGRQAPLRSAHWTSRTGFPSPSFHPGCSNRFAWGHIFALQSAKFLREAHGLGVGFVIETPEPRPGIVSVFTLPEFLALSELGGVMITAFDQCRFGAESSKPTALMYYRVDLSHLTLRCNLNPIHRQWQDWHGRWTSGFRAHLPLAGRRSPDGTPATKAAAAYPFRMNRALAKAFTSSGRATLRQPALS